MRIVKLSTMDNNGGAARAAMRLHKGLRALDIDSRFVVQQKTVEEPGVYGPHGTTAKLYAKTRLLLDQLPVIPHWHHSSGVFAPGWLPGHAWQRANELNPDIVHLHWITKGFLGIHDLVRLNAPIVWTLHDMWALTGGCHYDIDCGRYRSQCGKCPTLGSEHEHDLAYRMQSAKLRAWQGLDMTIVCPSRWLADCARNSKLLGQQQIEVIPNGINLAQYYPLDKAAARQRLSFNTDSKLILFGAMDATVNERKGFSQLQSALRQLVRTGWGKRASVIVFGSADHGQPPPADFPVQYIPPLHNDEELAALYSAADVFVAPSLQDNLPNTVMEALACGTPCVAFDSGGMPDMIEHMQNGYLARAFDADALAEGIAWVLEDTSRWKQLSQNARAHCRQHFELAAISKRHLEIYNNILERQRQAAAN